MKRKVFYATLIVLVLGGIGIGTLLHSESALQWVFARMASLLDGKLTVASLQGDLAGPIEITGLEYRAARFTLRANKLTLDWQPAWLLAATVRLHDSQAEDVSVELPAHPPPPGRKVLHLPLRIAFDAAQIKRLQIIGPENTYLVIIDRAEVTGSALGNTLYADAVHIETDQSHGDISGRLVLGNPVKVDLQLRGLLQHPAYPTARGEIDFDGDNKHLKIAMRLTTPLKGQLRGTIDDLLTESRWKARVDIDEAALPDLHPRWPMMRMRGHIDAHGTRSLLQAQSELETLGPVSGRVHANLKLQRLPKTHLSINLRSKAASTHPPQSAPMDYPFVLALNWDALQLAHETLGSMEASAGKLLVEGLPDKYTFGAHSQLHHPRLHDMVVDVHGSGDTRQLRGDARAAILGGTMDASGTWRWAPRKDWRVAMRAREIDPGKIHSDWPGRLTLAAVVRGEGQQLWLDDATVTGTVRGQAVRLHTQLARNGERYTLTKLNAHLGDAAVTASGYLAERASLTWDINVPQLSLWMGDARGGFSSAGKLDGPRTAPHIAATLQGQRLAFQGYRAAKLGIQIDVDMQDAQDSNAHIELADISTPQGKLSAFALQSQGRLRNNTHTLSATAGGADTKLTLHGAYANRAWTGMLTDATLHAAQASPWRLEKPAALRIAPDAVHMDAWCLQQDPGRVCTQGAWRKHAGWEGTLRATRFPLDLLQPLLLADIGLSGTVDADVSARADAEGKLTGNADVAFSPGSVRYPASGDTQIQVAYASAQGHMRMQDGQAQTRLALKLDDKGWLNAELAFPLAIKPAHAGADASVRGEIKAAFHDLSPLALFFPQFYQTRGTIDGGWQVSGTLQHPHLRGKLTLNDGAADIPRLGIHLHDAQLALSGDGGETLKLQGQVRSGKGSLNLDGSLDLRDNDAWSAALRLHGQDLEVANTPEVFLLATPDLKLEIRPRILRMDGNIHIPEARIEPKDLARATLASADVVTVGQDDLPMPMAKWKIYSRVQLDLGEKIHFSGFNFSVDVAGSIVATDVPEKPTTGLGELHVVKGKYTVYRQDLTIERGRLIFASSPLSDPGLDMRAVRRTGEVLAGVLARGTLKSPQLTLFSEPTMGETDILSYLILGRPADLSAGADGQLLYQAAVSLGISGGELLAKKIGQTFGIEDISIQTGSKPKDTALAIGTYLSPRLYINYGIGLLEPVNTLRLRYRISKNWQFQSETGTHSGADLLYTIER